MPWPRSRTLPVVPGEGPEFDNPPGNCISCLGQGRRPARAALHSKNRVTTSTSGTPHSSPPTTPKATACAGSYCACSACPMPLGSIVPAVIRSRSRWVSQWPPCCGGWRGLKAGGLPQIQNGFDPAPRRAPKPACRRVLRDARRPPPPRPPLPLRTRRRAARNSATGTPAGGHGPAFTLRGDPGGWRALRQWGRARGRPSVARG
jgi:hypothetical protein